MWVANSGHLKEYYGHNYLYDSEFWANHCISICLPSSDLSFPIIFLISRVRFQFVTKPYKLKKTITSKQKQQSYWLLILCSIIITGYLTQIYNDRVNDPYRIQMYGATLLQPVPTTSCITKEITSKYRKISFSLN